MTKTKEDYDRMNAKMSYAKGQITRYINSILTLCAKLQAITARGVGQYQPTTAKKIAVEIEKMRDTLERNSDKLELAVTNLTEVIVEMIPTETPLGSLDLMMAQVNQI